MTDQTTQSGIRSELGSLTEGFTFNEDANVGGFAILLRNY